MNVILAGGGTAGHVFPALAVAEELRNRGASITFVGAADGQEAKLVPAAGYRFVPVDAISSQSRLSLRSIKAVALAVRAARGLRSLVAASDVVVGFGGFASAPAVLAARWTSRPLVLIDPNSVPGIVTRIGSRWARVVATTFEAIAARLPAGVRIELTGNPIRPAVVSVLADRDRLRPEARVEFGLQPGRSTILVTGGSQGALHLDQAVAGALEPLRARRDLQLLVSSGPGHEDVVAAAIDPHADIVVRVIGFIERMDLALAIADVSVSRSGAGLVEVAACGVPGILVPYPHATENHQEANAREVVEAGAATMIFDRELSPSRLASCILELVDDPGRRREMSAAALRWARPDAARRVADLVEEVLS